MFLLKRLPFLYGKHFALKFIASVSPSTNIINFGIYGNVLAGFLGFENTFAENLKRSIDASG